MLPQGFWQVLVQVLCFVYKSLHGMAPLYMVNLNGKYEPKRSSRSALTTHRTKRRSEDQAFVSIAPKLWNDLKQRYAWISCGNPPVPLELKNIITSLPLWIELRQAERVEYWLVMYFLKYVFWITFN